MVKPPEKVFFVLLLYPLYVSLPGSDNNSNTTITTQPVILSAAKDLSRRVLRSFAALRMTAGGLTILVVALVIYEVATR
jgi:hypothetical protein